MGLIELASANSLWRGVDLADEKKVLSWKDAGNGTYEGTVKGSGDNIYDVHIDKEHPRRSTCNCAFAEGRRVICKHMIALYLTADPEARPYLDRKEKEWEAEYEASVKEHEDALKRHVLSLSKQQLQQELLDALKTIEEMERYRW